MPHPQTQTPTDAMENMIFQYMLQAFKKVIDTPALDMLDDDGRSLIIGQFGFLLMRNKDDVEYALQKGFKLADMVNYGLCDGGMGNLSRDLFEKYVHTMTNDMWIHVATADPENEDHVNWVKSIVKDQKTLDLIDKEVVNKLVYKHGVYEMVYAVKHWVGRSKEVIGNTSINWEITETPGQDGISDFVVGLHLDGDDKEESDRIHTIIDKYKLCPNGQQVLYDKNDHKIYVSTEGDGFYLLVLGPKWSVIKRALLAEHDLTEV